MTKEDYFELAVNAFGDDKLDEAIRLVNKALELEPENGAFLDSLGWAYFRKGDLNEAEKYLTMAAQKKRPWEVFIGASLSLAAVSAIGVLVGTALGQYLPIEWIKRVAGAAFIVIGFLVLIGKF